MSAREATFESALALARAGDLMAAGRMIDQVLGRHPRAAAAHRLKGSILEQQGQAAQALVSYDRAIGLDPSDAASHGGRGGALLALGQVEAAVESLDRAVALAPDNAVAAHNRANALVRARRFEDAVAGYDRAIALGLDSPEPMFRRGLTRLLLRDFAGGWRDYESRWRVDDHLKRGRGAVSPQLLPRLDLNNSIAGLAGKTVLLVSEQGVGDQIMFASMIPDLLAVAGSVICVCDPRLLSLLSHSFPQVRFVDPRQPLTGISPDLIVPMGSLGLVFRTAPEAFPGTPYLRADPALVARWRARLGPGLRVGLSWRGGTPQTNGAARSISLAQLAPLLAVEGCDFVSLQYGEVEAEVAQARPEGRLRVFPAAEISDFEDLAGLTASLDVVVSVQTTLVHVAGALGTPCLTLIPQAPEWRYGLTGQALPWSSSVRLYRQTADGDWGLEAVTAEIRRRAG